ncbi:MAG: translation initiation factor IF-2 [Clostridia bacterium]|nr:translation initiation factor IF-2 [Clostridia bacterium]
MGVKLLGKIKVHELAKELGLTSKELIAKAEALGIEAKTHMSSLEDEDVERIRKESTSSKSVEKKTQEKAKEEKKPAAPVIIRREVIIEDEADKQREKEQKQAEQKNKHVGFVERNKNADYNIVYRNKPTKPMTVSELFGIGKKEETKKEEVKKQEVSVQKVEKTDVEKPVTEEPKKVETPAPVQERNNTRNFDNNRNNNFRNDNRNGFQNRNNFNRDGQNNRGNFQNRDNRFNNQNRNNNNGGNFNRERRPLDNKGIDKNIKDIMAIDVPEKENQRDFSSKAIDKAKNERKEEKNQKAARNNKKGSRFNEDFDGGKLKGLKQVDRLSNMFDDQEGGMLDYYDLSSSRGKKNKKKVKEESKQKIFQLTEITIPETITVKDLAVELKKTAAEVIKKLFGYGIMATINNEVDFDTAYLVAEEFGVTAKKKVEVKEEDILFDDSEDKEEELQDRPPVVVVMGHVDHGKTSLLDAIRETNVIEGEAGGITQAIGAYKVKVNDREITFLDTPGHEAFTSMRARGAQITDIAILVVAANDGVMPQTVEAINHAKAANVPIIVAVNKIDLPEANVDKVKQELMNYELVPEEWGGQTIFVPISAKKRMNINDLLEMVLLQADVMELKANPNKQAKGTVIEARLDKAKGPIASMLVQRGTLNLGDTIVVGSSIGRIRAMKDDKGQKVKKAGPSTPVEVMGLTEVPESGETFYEVKDEKMAKHLIERRKRTQREKTMNAMTKVTLDNLFSQMEQGNLKQLNIIVKADVQGSAEALKQSLEKLSDDEVKVRVIHSAAGAVTESDVTLAKVANAIIIAFNVRPVATAKTAAEKDEVEIKQYSVIYQAIDDVKAAMKGMLDPVYEEKVIGNVEVRQTFKVSNVGTIAGAYVLDGKIERNAGVRVLRENVVIHEGKLVSLKRFKDDVKEVAKGYECGMQIENYNDLKEGDIIEVYIMEEVKR